eukprot:COSAG02_NODE_59124_length_275_cov_0.590909_1_plen_35_part_01
MESIGDTVLAATARAAMGPVLVVWHVGVDVLRRIA